MNSIPEQCINRNNGVKVPLNKDGTCGGRMFGGWTFCVHGVDGHIAELQKEIDRLAEYRKIIEPDCNKCNHSGHEETCKVLVPMWPGCGCGRGVKHFVSCNTFPPNVSCGCEL